MRWGTPLGRAKNQLKFTLVALGLSWWRLGGVLGPSWGRLGGVLGRSWGRLGALFGAIFYVNPPVTLDLGCSSRLDAIDAI